VFFIGKRKECRSCVAAQRSAAQRGVAQLISFRCWQKLHIFFTNKFFISSLPVSKLKLQLPLATTKRGTETKK